MFAKFYPYNEVESVFSIDYERLAQLGYQGLIFDIDQTLVNHGDPVTPEVEALFARLAQQGFKTIFLSNNSPERLQEFSQNMAVPFIALANKPEPEAYKKALAVLDLPAKAVLMIGDQVFTDVLGANRAGLASILVRFIRRPHEVNIGKKRRVEQVLLWFYRRSSAYNRLGHISK